MDDERDREAERRRALLHGAPRPEPRQAKRGDEVWRHRDNETGRIAQAITAGKAQQLETAELSAARVLEELRRLALVDARSFWDAEGRLKKPCELTAEQGAALAGFEVLIKNAKAGDGQIEEIHKIKLWDKTRALQALAKHFGLVKDRVEVSGWDVKVALLQHARTVGPTPSPPPK